MFCGEKGSYFLLSYVAGVVFVVEQDEPSAQLNVRCNRQGTVITGTHHPSYLVKEPGLGLILRIFPVNVIGNIIIPCSSR